MRSASTLFLLLGTLFTAGGYGATFLISAWFKSQGGSDIDAGTTLGAALIGTLVGVPFVGWFSGWLKASKLTAISALIMGIGYLLLGSINEELNIIPSIAVFLIGLGWGMFYIGAPMALSERITDVDRSLWFTRFSAFQMAGMCSSPIILTTAVELGGIPIQTTFLFVGGVGILASLLLATFHVIEPGGQTKLSLRPWVKKITILATSSAARPIVMVGLGGCIFSGMMSFQISLVEGTQASASTFFAVHAVTVVISRLLLARRLSIMPRIPLITLLLSCLIAGIICLLGIPFHPNFQIAAAILTGIGYGLMYPIIQTWTINDSASENRHAALTWFVGAYFFGIFGFPALGGWILVEAGKAWFILVLTMLGTLQLAVALVNRQRP